MARILTFGKYKFQKISDMIESNPKYIDWARKNVPFFKLTPLETEKLNKQLYGSN